MNRNKELAVNTFYLTLGKISTQFISFLLLPLYTSVLTTSEYGTVDLINTYQQLLVYVVFLQIEQSIFRFLIETRKSNDVVMQKQVISSAAAVAVISSVVFTLLYTLFHKVVDSQYTIFILLNVLAVSFSGLMLQIARGFGDNISYVLGSFISALTTIACNVLFVGFMRVGAGGMLTAIFIGNIVCIFVIAIRCKVYKYISLKSVAKKTAKKMLLYSLPLIPNSIAWWVIGASDRTVVLMFMGASFNGLLAISHKFSTVYSAIFQIFNLSWTESAALHIYDDDRSEFFTDIINKALILFGCLCIGIIACMPFVFKILVNPQYGDAYYQIPLFMIGAFLNAVQGVYSVIYIGLKQTKKLAASTIMAAVINVVAGVFLIGKIGLFAAPVSTILAYTAIVIYRCIDLSEELPIKLDMKKMLILVALMGVTLLSYYCFGYFGKVIVLGIVAVMAFVLNKEMLISLARTFLKKIR